MCTALVLPPPPVSAPYYADEYWQRLAVYLHLRNASDFHELIEHLYHHLVIGHPLTRVLSRDPASNQDPASTKPWNCGIARCILDEP